MKLGVLLTRRTQLKVLSPVIAAGVQRGHDVRLVADPRPAKRGDTLEVKELARVYPSLVVEDGWRGLDGVLDVLVGVDSTLPAWTRTRLVGVDHFFDSWLTPPRRDVTMCYSSAFHRDTRPDPSGHLVGFLPGDQACGLPIRTAPRDSAVFFTLKLDVPEPWRQTRDGALCYRDIYEQSRAAAREHGLEFVVKSRAKNRDPWWVRWYADAYVLDERMVPYTSLTLLSRAAWAVHFESGAALECALMGAYGYVLRVSQDHVTHLPGAEHIYHLPGRPAPRMHAWPGVTKYALPDDMMSPIPTQRDAYLAHFLGPVDGQAGQRVLEIAEGLCAKWNRCAER